MLLRNIPSIVVVGILLLTLTVPVHGRTSSWQMVYGDVVQVFAEQQKILMESGGQKSILAVDCDCVILRLGKPASLESLRPIASGVYQDALCWVNSQGLVSYILVNYLVQEEDGLLVNYDIFGNLK